MEVDMNPPYDWANDAFVALNDANEQEDRHEKWPQYSDAQQTFPPHSFSIPPSLISQASIERYGQITPPEELTATAAEQKFQREDSIPVEQLRNEPSLPMEQKVQQLANFQPDQQTKSQPPQQIPTPEEEDMSSRTSKRRRTSKPSPANQTSQNATTEQQAPTANPQPPKRKRGRPKAQPQMVETFTADGFPVQVSSARQSHLEKNRVAAHKCRQRKKEYINGLEGRAREFSAKNKALKENVAVLREEVLQLKNEVLRHAGCGFWAVDEYLARCAGDLLGMEGPSFPTSRQNSTAQSPTLSNLNSTMKVDQQPTTTDPMLSRDHESPFSQGTDDFDGLDFLNDDDMDLDGTCD